MFTLLKLMSIKQDIFVGGLNFTSSMCERRLCSQFWRVLVWWWSMRCRLVIVFKLPTLNWWPLGWQIIQGFPCLMPKFPENRFQASTTHATQHRINSMENELILCFIHIYTDESSLKCTQNPVFKNHILFNSGIKNYLVY